MPGKCELEIRVKKIILCELEFRNKKDPLNKSLDYYVINLMGFGLFLHNSAQISVMDDYREFQSLLDEYFTWKNETFYNPRRSMKKVGSS